MRCEGKIGCHGCIAFLEMVEIKISSLRWLMEHGTVEEIRESITEVLELIQNFKKE